jgi:hypothetical protein
MAAGVGGRRSIAAVYAASAWVYLPSALSYIYVCIYEDERGDDVCVWTRKEVERGGGGR